MLGYESDNGNSCLLDMIKDEVIWWLYPNGTLKESTKKLGKPLYRPNKKSVDCSILIDRC